VALLRARAAVSDSRRVIDDVHMITSREALESALASGAKPNELRVYLGYSGWGPGQLEIEMARGAWHVLPADADLVFDPEPDSVWRRQIDRTERLIVWQPSPILPTS
jgi:putative transcriptional regulator